MAVYFMSGEGIPAIKIGFTSMEAPERRLHSCQVWSPVRLRLEAVDHGGDLLTEAELLWRFRADRMHGEWFLATVALRAVVDAVKRGRGIPDAWRLPPWFKVAQHCYPRGLNTVKFRQRFGLSRAECAQLGGVDSSHLGLAMIAIPRVLAHLRTAGHDITYLDLLEPAAPAEAAA